MKRVDVIEFPIPNNITAVGFKRENRVTYLSMLLPESVIDLERSEITVSSIIYLSIPKDHVLVSLTIKNRKNK